MPFNASAVIMLLKIERDYQMRVSEARTNYSAAINVKTKTNYVNKQAFLALPYSSKTGNRTFSIVQMLYDFGTMINKQYNRIPVVREHKEKLAKNKKLIELLADLHTKGLAYEDMIKGPPTEFAKAVRKILEKKAMTPPHKQGFYALPYISKTTSRTFSIAQKIYDFGTYLNKNFNPVVIVRNIKKQKAEIIDLKVEVRSLDLQKEILSKKVQLKNLELMNNNIKIETMKSEANLNNPDSKSFFKPLTNEEINKLFRTPPFTNEQINEIVRNGRKAQK